MIPPETEKSGEVPIFKTEVSSSGDWKEFSIDLSILCNCDYVSPFPLSLTVQNRPVIIQLFRYKSNGSHQSLGSLRSTTQSLLQSASQTLPFTGDGARGSLTIDRCVFQEKASFLQFIQAGLELNFMVCIDFTGSNGSPTSPSSLHYANASNYNRGVFNQ